MDTTLVPYQVTLRSGHQALVRPLRPDDGPGLAEAFEQLSETSRYRRFFAVKPRLSEGTLALLTDVDHHDHEALVALAPDSGQLVGVARFFRLSGQPDQAEVAVTVIDSWQRRGLGTVLLRELAQRAATEGIRHFTAEILAENGPMLTLAHRLGLADTNLHGGTVSALIELPASGNQAVTFSRDGYHGYEGYDGHDGHDGYDLLRAAARGEFIGLPGVLRGWLDLSEKIIATLMAPVSAFCEISRRSAPEATPPGQPAAPHRSSPPSLRDHSS